MNLLRHLYRYLTEPIILAHDKKLREAKKVFQINQHNSGRNKFQYKRDCRDLNRIEKQLNAEMVAKINKYNWLKKLL
jgi:hypothetical protein